MKTTEFNEALSQFWEARTAREKLLLGWGGAVLAVAIAYSVLWSPAQEGRARIQRELPTMRHELAEMTAQANEARSLAGAAQGVAPTGAALKDALAASLSDHGLAAAPPQVVGGGVQIQLKNASFPAWTQWLDDVRRQFKAQVVEAHVSALKEDGQVDLTAVLQPASVK
ncbi:type II secretion system protein M [Burkholderia thailandensis]|uniref:Type II secretion system (T2SS), M family protein n=1 Tax=Burkholderia thailandensis TaxID=57975 RepID=A0AAW9D791_BURTH|nr:type II secretion system protein M [Burkholderia thailandensis]AHI64994.1 type II secretion system (T2SS), M family protein [Burkholderia thailandensis H0587]AOJ52389.1 general secretion pathway protein GspM [Burkholderia thailandensis]AVR26950.1 type II secretion system protein M [Burkholderia thailandensis]MCS3390557.1 type II secretion system protein M [Burkholderia thailandensis]MCS6424443.1 type II secretion system protein M [Burkholderia thailandensis]